MVRLSPPQRWLAWGHGSRIGRRIMLPVALSVALAVILVAGLFIAVEANTTLANRHKSIEATAYVFASAVADEIEKEDRQSILQTLRAIGRVPDITYAVVTDTQGRELAALGSVVLLQDDAGTARKGALSLFTSRSFPVAVDIVSGSVTVGHLIVVADVSDLRSKLWQAIGLTLFAAFAAGSASLLLAWRLVRRITQPLVSLTAAMREVRDTKTFTGSVEHQSDDETGALVDSFNSMLSEIASRDRALARHRETLEATVAQRTHELSEAKDAAESANRAKSSFLATMSHEIRTPLNGVMTMAELLAAGGLDNRQQRYAEVIVRSGQSLLTIINDILDLSKIEAGRLELEQINVDPVAVADDVISLFWERAASKSLDLATCVGPGVPRHMVGDPVRLTQILSNLVNNALKFTEKGQVLLTLTCEAGFLHFTVTDSGIGIDPGKIGSLFSAFTQADQSTTRRFGGTGLGLAICKRLSEAMGGSIAVKSEPGRGSSFRVSLPLPALKAPPAAAPRHGTAALVLKGLASRAALGTALTQAGYRVGIAQRDCRGADVVFCEASQLHALILPVPAPPVICLCPIGDSRGEAAVADGTAADLLPLPLRATDVEEMLQRLAAGTLRGPSLLHNWSAPRLPQRTFAGRRVLVADDNAVNREVMIEVLRQLKVSVDTAADGREAVDHWRRRKPDLVFMDCSMPDLDGYAATREIRAHERLDVVPRHTPVIALTALVAGSNDEAWRAAGMDAFMTKPFTLAAIAGCLENFLGASEPLTPDEPDDAAPLSLFDPAVTAELKSIGGSDILYRRVLDIFAAKAPSAVASLQTLSRSTDALAMADAAHALKSMCANIGAHRAVKACHDLEAAARTGQPFDAGGQTALIAREVGLVLREVELLRAA